MGAGAPFGTAGGEVASMISAAEEMPEAIEFCSCCVVCWMFSSPKSAGFSSARGSSSAGYGTTKAQDLSMVRSWSLRRLRSLSYYSLNPSSSS